MLVRAESGVNDHLALRGHPKIFSVKELQKALFGAFISCICHSPTIELSIPLRQFRSAIFEPCEPCSLAERRVGVLPFRPNHSITPSLHQSINPFPLSRFRV